MVVGDIILLGLSVITVIFAVLVVFNRSIFGSAIALISVMVMLGVMYAMIEVYFIAAIQLIVYAGAIMVFFIFSIMLLNSNEVGKEISYKSPLGITAISASVVLVFALLSLFWKPFEPLANSKIGVFNRDFLTQEGGNILTLSKLLFSQYYLHFEMISLLLMVALIGALTVAKRKVE